MTLTVYDKGSTTRMDYLCFQLTAAPKNPSPLTWCQEWDAEKYSGTQEHCGLLRKSYQTGFHFDSEAVESQCCRIYYTLT